MDKITSLYRSSLIIKTDKNVNRDKITNIAEYNKKIENLIRNNCYA
jgi:hypothetical protein